MSLVRSNLSCLYNVGVVGGGTNGVFSKKWGYKVGPAGSDDVADNLADIAAAAYFGDVVVEGVINDGDRILIQAADGIAEGIFAATGDATTIAITAVDVDPTA